MRRWTPFHLHIVRKYCEGQEVKEIALQVNRTEGQIRAIIDSPEGKQIIERLNNATMDTMVQCQTSIQAAAPIILQRKINLALHAQHESVANRACQELLELAGHVATRQVEIRRPDHVEEEFRDKSEADIKREILESINCAKGEEEGEGDSQRLLH